MNDLNNGHQVQFLTAASMIATMFDNAFDCNSAYQLGKLNPEINTLIERISDDLGELYQAIGNAEPWKNDEGRNNEVDAAVIKAHDHFDKWEQEFNKENSTPIGYGIKTNDNGWTEPFPYYHNSEVVGAENYWPTLDGANEAAEYRNKKDHSWYLTGFSQKSSSGRDWNF